MQEVVDDDRFEDVELEIPLRAGDRDRRVVADHLDGYHRHRLALSRIHLARHDRGARLVLRQDQFAEPDARSRAHPADVVGDFHQRDRQRLERSGSRHQRIVRRQRGEFVRRRFERQPGVPAIFAAAIGELRMGIEPGADRRAADGQFKQVRQNRLDTVQIVFELAT